VSRPVAVLRPEPGNAATCARLIDAGLTPIALPLFVVRRLDWTAPDPAAFDALLLTSANAIRHGGIGLAGLHTLPVLAVGAATAVAAERAGFAVAATGAADADALLQDAAAAGWRQLLHLGGRDRRIEAGGIVARAIAVYASEAVAVRDDALERLADTVVLLHSARAARSFAEAMAGHAAVRRTMRVAALSPAVATAAGTGWAAVAIAAAPDDAALVALARRLAD
jgi:uroporphyrinogen-III synthase